MAKFTNKLVAVLNKNVEPGKAMNALAHMCIGLGAKVGTAPLELVVYQDESDTPYPNISKMPFMVLRGNSNKITALYMDALASPNIQASAFTETMTIGTWEEQLQKTAEVNLDDMTFFGLVLFGPWDEISERTRKFSLWK